MASTFWRKRRKPVVGTSTGICQAGRAMLLVFVGKHMLNYTYAEMFALLLSLSACEMDFGFISVSNSSPCIVKVYASFRHYV